MKFDFKRVKIVKFKKRPLAVNFLGFHLVLVFSCTEKKVQSNYYVTIRPHQFDFYGRRIRAHVPYGFLKNNIKK